VSTFERTLLCVHAHPDDEAIFTAGATMLYAERGYRVVLITCTNGRLGIDQNNLGGNHPDHDPTWTVATRAQELSVAAHMVGVTRHIQLGYDDSGMAGWPQNEEAASFVSAPVATVATQILAVIEEERPAVVLTYDERGFYGHPDHVHAHQATMAAVQQSTSVERLYYPVIPQGARQEVRDLAQRDGLSMPAWVTTAKGTPDHLVSTSLPTAPYSERKRAAIAAHASQTDNAEIVALAPVLFENLFGREFYQRGWSRSEAHDDQTDLFGGLANG
jgi:LmbE family N-acetylglucosaminyl deacetylase